MGMIVRVKLPTKRSQTVGKFGGTSPKSGSIGLPTLLVEKWALIILFGRPSDCCRKFIAPQPSKNLWTLQHDQAQMKRQRENDCPASTELIGSLIVFYRGVSPLCSLEFMTEFMKRHCFREIVNRGRVARFFFFFFFFVPKLRFFWLRFAAVNFRSESSFVNGMKFQWSVHVHEGEWNNK